jgi:integrase
MLGLPQVVALGGLNMRQMMGVIKNRHGTYYAQVKVPAPLQQAVATLLGRSQPLKNLKKSLGTKDLREANIRAKPVLMEFDRTLERARELLKEKPIRSSLSRFEIARIAEFHYATVLGNDAVVRREARQIAAKFHDGTSTAVTAPASGLTDHEFESIGKAFDADLKAAQAALARGNIEYITPEIEELLYIFGVRLDPTTPAYRLLGSAVLAEHVKALRALQRRHAGEPVETPPQPELDGSTNNPHSGETLRAAFEGWQRERRPAQRALTEYHRAIALFVELHGDLPVVQIKRSHARLFREALQQVPRQRTGALLQATLPQIVEWGQKNPDAARVSATTVNKQLGGLQAVVRWAYDKGGFIPDDMTWADPFARMRLDEDDPDRAPFNVAELKKLFGSPVFIDRTGPKGARGEVDYWLPLLALFTGGRRGELAGLRVADVQDIDGHTMLTFVEDREAGRRLKTRNSQRAVPLHPTLRELGFLDYVHQREADGHKAWLFPSVAPDRPGALEAWTKWFGRYRRSLGISDTNVFHSFRHNFIDALRAARVDQEMREALFGHGWHRTTTTGGYGVKDMVLRFSVNGLADAIASVSYPGLDLSHLVFPKVRTKQSQKSRARPPASP